MTARDEERATRPTVKATAALHGDEASLQAAIVEAARFFGWLVYHTHDSRRSPAGFPDLVLVRGDEHMFVELKSTKGELTPEQCMWISALVRAHAEVHVWRPIDLDHALERLRWSKAAS